MCSVAPEKRRQFHCSQEIIQIGAALMDDNLEVADTFSCYVRPCFGKLDGFLFCMSSSNAVIFSRVRVWIFIAALPPAAHG